MKVTRVPGDDHHIFGQGDRRDHRVAGPDGASSPLELRDDLAVDVGSAIVERQRVHHRAELIHARERCEGVAAVPRPVAELSFHHATHRHVFRRRAEPPASQLGISAGEERDAHVGIE